MSENQHDAVANVATMLAPIRERANLPLGAYGAPQLEEDRARLLAALDAVEDLAKYLDTLAPGDKHYAALIRAAVTAALGGGELKGSIESNLQEWATAAMTDPWPERIVARAPEKLTYTALVRCACGAGMAYPTYLGSEWGCSAILTGQAQPGPDHSGLYPFYMWKFKTENAETTTRPKETR